MGTYPIAKTPKKGNKHRNKIAQHERTQNT